jgi:small subunit ribosomal protein S1
MKGNLVQKLSKQLLDKYDYDLPEKGELRTGILLDIDEHGALVDIGLKHDGVVSRQDLDRLDDSILAELEPGQEVTARVIQARDQEGSLKLSLAQVQAQEDWKRAQSLFDRDEIWYGTVNGFNRGGLLVNFHHIQAFVPASHLRQRIPSGQAHQRTKIFKGYIGRELPLKLIEINQLESRLIASERLARKELEQKRLEELLDELTPGEIVTGVVRNLTKFGAFVDLGGAEGLVHISELAWENVRHPRDVVAVGDEIDVVILELDHERKRVNLSRKETLPNPWHTIGNRYSVGQLVTGAVRNVVEFGAFVELERGIQGLLHVSEIATPTPDHPREFVQRGDQLLLKIVRMEPEEERISLSLKEVTVEEQRVWEERGIN